MSSSGVPDLARGSEPFAAPFAGASAAPRAVVDALTGAVVAPLNLKFTRNALNNVDDVAGRWQFEGGSVTQNNQHVANYSSIKRVTYKGTDQDGQNTASVTTTIFFIGSHPPGNITLEGAHDFSSGNQTGSVSASSNAHKARIGKQYTRDGATGNVQIS